MMFPGIVFETDAGGAIAIRTVRRADLAADRLDREARAVASGRLAAQSVHGVVATSSLDLAHKLRRALVRAFARSGSRDTIPPEAARDALERCRKLGFTCRGDTDWMKARRKRYVETVSQRLVPNPLITEAQRLAEIEKQPNNRRAGRIMADVNLAGLIGGLAGLRGISEAQTRGAADFRLAAERSQIGGAKALDYTKTRVDTSGPTANAEIEGTERARRQYLAAVEQLGGLHSPQFRMADTVIVNGNPIAAAARHLGYGKGGAGHSRARAVLIEATDLLAIAFGHAAPPVHHAHARAWTDGSRARIVGEGEAEAA